MAGSDQKEVSRFARAEIARESAYAPHSGHAVGAVLYCDDGTAYEGANVEVSGRSTSIHAEMAAAYRAVLDGNTDWERIVVTELPCAMCAHTLAEWATDSLAVETPEGTFELGDFLGESYRPGDHDE